MEKHMGNVSWYLGKWKHMERRKRWEHEEVKPPAMHIFSTQVSVIFVEDPISNILVGLEHRHLWF